jgi:hypothetical protein
VRERYFPQPSRDRKGAVAYYSGVIHMPRPTLLLTLLACATLANAQHQMPPASEKPVALLSGLGSWRHPIATRSPEAQKFFDQGLVLLYGFNR